ncbi:MAG TPA: DUF1614 domain-containing protein [Candidatus Thermoplasmatota archaeon]|nr:DUF1614 domain-containing protein [Candidatus Thermoplasmatota archaeon]
MSSPFLGAAQETFSWSDIPWGFLLALTSLGAIYLFYRRRTDVFRAFGFTTQEVAILCVGSVAGWVVNVPTPLPIGDSYLTFNLGGALIPLFLVGYWAYVRKLPLLRAAGGIALVAYVTHLPLVTEVVPGKGVLSQFPYFFLPPLVALAYALVVCFKDPIKGVPVAYASGSLGALLGADVLHFPTIQAVFRDAPATDVLSFGGAGVFDMVFLAGAMAMALNLGLLLLFHRRGLDALPEAGPEYPAKPLEIRDSRKVWNHYRTLQSPAPVERAVAAIALSNLALRDGDFNRSVRMSYLAVDSLRQGNGPSGGRIVVRGGSPDLQRDVDFLAQAYREATAGRATRLLAGDANVTAKVVVAALSRGGHKGSRLAELVP